MTPGVRQVDVLARDDEGRKVLVAAVASEEGYVCETLTVDGSVCPVTSETLRAIPVSSIAKAAAYNAAFVDPEGGDLLTLIEWLLWPKHVMEQWPNGDRELVHTLTAATYTLAAFHGLGPTKAVRDAAETSQATAGRLIRAARDAGYLTAKPPSQSGGRGSGLLYEFLQRKREEIRAERAEMAMESNSSDEEAKGPGGGGDDGA